MAAPFVLGNKEEAEAIVSKDEGETYDQREALEWMIRLQERPDDAALHDRFRLWRETPAHDEAWSQLDHVSALIRQLPPSGGVARVPAVPDRRWRRGGRTILAPFALAASLTALFIGHDLLPIPAAATTTRTGEVRTMTLADGSRVTLAPRSAMTFDGARHARLLRGSAYFQVRHDDDHPFQVVAGDAVATDLGTAFEIAMEDATTHIAVREGAVGASCAGGWEDLLPLRPGQTEDLDCASGSRHRGEMPPSRVAAWATGRLVMIDRPLATAIAALRPWHKGWLIARGPGMARHVTGVYDLRHSDRALAAMRQAHGLSITQITPWITIVHAD